MFCNFVQLILPLKLLHLVWLSDYLPQLFFHINPTLYLRYRLQWRPIRFVITIRMKFAPLIKRSLNHFANFSINRKMMKGIQTKLFFALFTQLFLIGHCWETQKPSVEAKIYVTVENYNLNCFREMLSLQLTTITGNWRLLKRLNNNGGT